MKAIQQALDTGELSAEVQEELEALILAARYLATEADNYQNDEGDGMVLADAIIDVERALDNIQFKGEAPKEPPKPAYIVPADGYLVAPGYDKYHLFQDKGNGYMVGVHTCLTFRGNARPIEEGSKEQMVPSQVCLLCRKIEEGWEGVATLKE